MFFRKKHEAEQSARMQTLVKLGTGICDRFDAAEKLADPAEKLVAFTKLETEIDAATKEVASGADTDSFFRGMRNGFATFGAVTIGCIALAATVSPWLLVLALPGIVVAGKVGGRSSDKMRADRAGENGDFMAGAQLYRTRAETAVKSLIDNDWQRIATAPNVAAIFQDVPALREKCAAAFAKGVANGDISAPRNPAANDVDPVVATQQPIVVPHSLRLKKHA